MTFDSSGVDVETLLPLVRPAVPFDHPALLALDRQGRHRVLQHKGSQAWLVEHEPLESVDDIPTETILVAVLAGEVVGFLMWRDVTDEQRGRRCVIDRVYVEEEARGIGCGDALVAHAMLLAVERKCSALEGDALPGDRETKNLYERAGITARKIVVSRMLNDPSIAGPSSR